MHSSQVKLNILSMSKVNVIMYSSHFNPLLINPWGMCSGEQGLWLSFYVCLTGSKAAIEQYLLTASVLQECKKNVAVLPKTAAPEMSMKLAWTVALNQSNQVPVNERLYQSCKVIEDEKHVQSMNIYEEICQPKPELFYAIKYGPNVLKSENRSEQCCCFYYN